MLLSEIGLNSCDHDEAIKAMAATRPSEITAAVRIVTEVYCRLYNIDPADINHGMCEDFAHDVQRVFPDAEPVWDDELHRHQEDLRTGHGEHCFLMYCGLFYDSEAPGGVAKWWQLPLYRHLARRKV